MSVNWKAKFSKDTRENDGLSHPDIVNMLLQRPLEMYAVVALVRNAYEKKDHVNGGIVTPTVETVRVEMALDEDDIKAITEILGRRFRERTGREAPTDLFTTADGTVVGGVMDGVHDPSVDNGS